MTKIPSEHVTITTENGTKLTTFGDLTRTNSRKSLDQFPKLEYWLSSFSSELDPRLLEEFPSPEKDDAILVIFEVLPFLQRCISHFNKIAPISEKTLETIDYHDMYHPTTKKLEVRSTKDIRFAHQREWRMTIDPHGLEELRDGGAFFVEVGSIEDIAGIYSPEGHRIFGSGPNSFLE